MNTTAPPGLPSVRTSAVRVSGSEPLVFDLDPDRQTATIEIVIPVYNEQGDLESSVTRLSAYLAERFPLSWLVTIADNASIDDTWRLANASSSARFIASG